MTNLRLFSLVIAFGAATLLITSALGGTTPAADRGVSVAVSGDETAYVGYETEDIAVTANESQDYELLTVTNQFDEPITDVDIEIEESPTPLGVETPDRIGVGQSATIDAESTCTSESGTVTATVTVETSGATATLDGKSETQHRSFTLSCNSDE